LLKPGEVTDARNSPGCDRPAGSTDRVRPSGCELRIHLPKTHPAGTARTSRTYRTASAGDAEVGCDLNRRGLSRPLSIPGRAGVTPPPGRATGSVVSSAAWNGSTG